MRLIVSPSRAFFEHALISSCYVLLLYLLTIANGKKQLHHWPFYVQFYVCMIPNLPQKLYQIMMFVRFRNTYKILSHKYVIYFYEQNLHHILYNELIVTCKVIMVFICIKYVYKIVLSVHKKYSKYNESTQQWLLITISDCTVFALIYSYFILQKL